MSFAPPPSTPDAPLAVIVIGPRTAPRDLLDAVAILAVGAPQAAVLLGAPLALGYYLHGSIEIAVHVYMLAACFLLLGLYALVLVWSLRIDAAGIRFRRLLGRPKFLAWGQLTAVGEVTRRETVVTYAFYPWRALTMGMTTRHMFRIEWNGQREFYFPPADVQAFRRAVHGGRPDLLPLVDPEPPGASQLLPPAEETGNPYQAPKSDLIGPGPDV